MILPVELVTCLAVIAGAARFATAEYVRARKDRQISQALVRALTL